uniref:NADH dehydrogenase subunit 6 n=1 Tax=Tenebroides mauritanicus TaxID=433272 RepID=UPI002000EEBC|nr:NADH dehydrogenase subunit 6 [Tenebroides mauritanicus]UNZ12740.1 NADH dehydrogenase subunit 6 [Tenebroides mauritanicus]
MSLILSINLTISATIIFLKHPLALGAILLTQTVLIALIVGTLNLNFWFSYIITLIMIGGMLILFIYMTSIASNEKFKFSPLVAIYTTIVMMLSMLTIMMDQYLMNIKMKNQEMTDLENLMDFQLMMNKFINWPNSIMLYLTVTYLFITLIAVVKITNIKQGPLRQSY